MSKNIVLIGYMASGKSAVGAVLANKRSLKFIDLDAYIESKMGLSIPLIFEEKGEIFFRKIERQYLFEVLKAETACVLAVGGGTPCYGDNMQLINKHAKSIFLKTPLKVLVDRLKNGKKDRPLVAHFDDAELTEFVAKHLFERNPYYEQSAISIDANENYSPRRIVDLIDKIITP